MTPIRYRIAIRRESDQRVHLGRWTEWHIGTGITNDDAMEGMNFWWSEGNGSCDCNRHTMFESVANPDHLDETVPCGDSEYSLVRIEIDSSSSC